MIFVPLTAYNGEPYFHFYTLFIENMIYDDLKFEACDTCQDSCHSSCNVQELPVLLITETHNTITVIHLYLIKEITLHYKEKEPTSFKSLVNRMKRPVQGLTLR